MNTETLVFTVPLAMTDLLSVVAIFSATPGTIFLLSGGSYDSGKHSFLAVFPTHKISLQGNTLTKDSLGAQETLIVEDPWAALQVHFFDGLEVSCRKKAFGWFGYGLAAASLDLPNTYRASSLPDAYWQRSAVEVSFDHQTSEVIVEIDLSSLPRLSFWQRQWVERLSSLEGWLSVLKEQQEANSLNTPYQAVSDYLFMSSKQEYMDKVEQIQEWILEGNVYQVNLAQQLHFRSEQTPFEIFLSLTQKNPAPFSAFLHTEYGTIISTSPERFLSKKGHLLETRPIKGTMPRGKNVEEDAAHLQTLKTSDKELAELLMITDLMRNDLGKISLPGTVSVLELQKCEAYTNVFHLLSVIQSKVQNLKALEIVKACFPAGSITGCPKESAVRAIYALESCARGIYTGSIGYFTSEGDFDLNVAIRTAVFDGKKYELQLGSGIVIDSDPEKEYEETLHKGASFLTCSVYKT